MGAIQGAIIGATGGTAALLPRRDIPYGHLEDRLMRYVIAESYIHNTIYDSLNLQSTWIKQEEGLYQFIRGIVNPVKQENDLIVSYTYKGTIDSQSLKGGSMPLVYDNDALETPLKQIIKWSNLDQQLGIYVHDAALYGDSAWFICDDMAKGRVRLELIDPAKIKYVERDEVGNIKAAVIEYLCEEQPDVERYQPGWRGMHLLSTQQFVKTIKITKDGFYTFKDGKPFGFYLDANGNPLPEWENPYGFVPLKLATYAAGKDGWGQNSFFGTPRRQIDELNDQASIINDSVRSVIAPLLMGRNIRNSDIKVSRENKDSVAVIFVTGQDAALEPIVIPIDIAGASANRQAMLTELKKNMPILALQDIRDIGGDLSGVAIATMFGDAVSSIENVRKNLNPALIGALQMAVTIGGIRGYDGFAGFNVNSYDAGNMELSIKETPVIDDKLARDTRIDKIISIAPLPTGSKRVALAEVGFTDDQVDTIITEDDAAMQAKQAQFQQNTQQLGAGPGAPGNVPQLPAGEAQKPPNGTQPPDAAKLMDIWKRIGNGAVVGATA